MSLNGGQPNFARYLAAHALLYYICIFGGSCPLIEFCQLQNSLCIQVLHSPILPALLHGTRAAAVSQTLCRGTRNGITELSQRTPPIFGKAAITLGIGQHSSPVFFSMPIASSQKLDVYHTSTRVALVEIYNAGLKCAARSSLKVQDATNCQKFASWAHRTTSSGCTFATKACINNWKKNS